MKRHITSLRGIVKTTSGNNFMHLALNQGTNVLIAVILTPYLFQTLGEEEFGLVSLGLTVILLFGIVVNYGFNLNIPKKLALVTSDREAKEKLINEVIVTRLILSLGMIALIFLINDLFSLFLGYKIILIFSTIQLLNDALFPMFILQGLDRLAWISRANAVSKLLYLILIFLIVKGSQDAKWVNFILGGTGVLIHGLLVVHIYRSEAIKFRWVGLQKVKTRLLDNFQFFSSTIAAYLLVNGGFIILSYFVASAELGFYALAQRVSVLLRMIPVFLAQSILQHAARLHLEDKFRFEEYLAKSYKKGLIITFAVGVLLAVLAPWIVWVLAGEYIPLSASLMSILCFLPFLGMLNIPNMIRILVTERKHILAKAIWSTTVLMIVLGSIGSYYYGSLGLAWALIVSEIINYVTHRYFLLKEKNFSSE